LCRLVWKEPLHHHQFWVKSTRFARAPRFIAPQCALWTSHRPLSTAGQVKNGKPQPPGRRGDEEGQGACTTEQVIESTRGWIEKVVVGLRFCPFARLDETRLVCASAEQVKGSLDSFIEFLRGEVMHLQQHPQIASTLVVFPHEAAFQDFLVFNAAVSIATEELSVDQEGKEVPNIIHQVAQFHPQFFYEGLDEESVENYTSRSPYPTVHLIRASLITAARENHGEDYLLRLPEANAKRLQALGMEHISKLFH